MATEFADRLEAELAEVPDAHYDESKFVGSVGPWDADVVFVGEAPGAQEVEQGEPFVGNAGRRLDSFLEDVGIDRDRVYITNLVKVRPPENRDPTREEIDAWWPVLRAELDRVDPDVVVPLGAFAAREILDEDGPLGDLHGQTYEREGYTVLPTYHPAATFYDDSVEASLVEDLERVAELANAE